MPGSREEDFLRNTSILHFLPDDGRQPIAIGHLSDSGDLKNILNQVFRMKVILTVSVKFFGSNYMYHTLFISLF